MSSKNMILQLWKIQHHLSPKLAIVIKKQTVLWTEACNCHKKTGCPMDGNCLSECLIYKASVSTTNKSYYGTCENTFKEHEITRNVLLEINLLKRILNYPSMYPRKLKESEILIFLLIGILLNMFVNLKSVIYAFVRSFLLQELIRIFYSKNWWACLNMLA